MAVGWIQISMGWVRYLLRPSPPLPAPPMSVPLFLYFVFHRSIPSQSQTSRIPENPEFRRAQNCLTEFRPASGRIHAGFQTGFRIDGRSLYNGGARYPKNDGGTAMTRRGTKNSCNTSGHNSSLLIGVVLLVVHSSAKRVFA